MSKFIYLSRLLYFSVLAQFFEVFSQFKKLNNKIIIFNSSRNNNYNFNSKYLFEYLLEEHKEFCVFFVINNQQLRKQLTEEIGPYFISTLSISGILQSSKAGLWVSSVMESPYLVFPWIKNRRRYYYHIGHGVPLKKIGLSEEEIPLLKYLNRYFRTRIYTHVLSYSQSFKPVMENAFKKKGLNYVYLGQPRNDNLSIGKSEAISRIKETYPHIKDNSTFVLYAPTWRNYSQARFFPFEDLEPSHLNDILIEQNVFLFLREHPYHKFQIRDGFLNQSNILSFNADKFSEVMEYLVVFDKLITDYSSIYLDFLCLNRPIAFIPYDKKDYIKYTGFTYDYDKITPGLKINEKNQFLKFLTDEDDFVDRRFDVAELVNVKAYNNCRENALFISELLNNT